MPSSHSVVIRCRIIWVALWTAASIVLLSSCWVVAPVQAQAQAQAPLDDSHTTHEGLHSDTPSDDVSRKSLDCTCRQHQPVSSQSSQSSQHSQPTSGGARIFYLVLVHNLPTLQDAIPLFRALRDPRHSVVFHVDRKVYNTIEKAINVTNSDEHNPSDGEKDSMTSEEIMEALHLQQALRSLQDELESCPCGSRVHIDSVHTVQWSHWSMNLPTLWGMELATTHATFVGKWDTFINLSGDSLPVFTPHTLAHSVAGLSQYNIVTSRSCETGLIPTSVYQFPHHWHKRQHYTNRDRDPPPRIEYTTADGTPHSTNVTIYFGSQWVVLQAAFVAHLVQELSRPDSFACQFRDYLLDMGKVMTDETFLPTVLMHTSPYNTTTLPQVHTEQGEWKDSLIYHHDNVQNNHDTTMPLPRIQTLRYERMDERYPSPLRNYYPIHPRYEVPHNMSTQHYQILHNLQLPPEPHIWGPYYLGVYDLADIRASGALFLRKVSRQVDPNLHHLLPVETSHQIPNIQWPPGGVQASLVPDWESEKLELMKIAYRKAKAQGAKIPAHIQQQMEGGGTVATGDQATPHDTSDLPAKDNDRPKKDDSSSRHTEEEEAPAHPSRESHQRELGAA